MTDGLRSEISSEVGPAGSPQISRRDRPTRRHEGAGAEILSLCHRLGRDQGRQPLRIKLLRKTERKHEQVQDQEDETRTKMSSGRRAR